MLLIVFDRTFASKSAAEEILKTASKASTLNVSVEKFSAKSGEKGMHASNPSLSTAL